jgi:ABC-type lipoprotein release transport system permease subunit
MTLFGRRGSLRHTRLQLVLAVAAIGVAVALPVVLVSVGGGVSSHELNDLENAGYQIVVSAPGLHGIADSHALAGKFLALSGVTAVSPVLSEGIDTFEGTGGPTAALAEGIIPGQFLPTLGPAENGLFPSPLPLGDPTDSVHYANGTYAGRATLDVMISSPFADAQGLHVGEPLLLGPNANRSQAVAYTITGTFGVPPNLLGPIGAFAVVLPLSDLQEMTGYAAAAHAVVADGSDTIEVAVTGSVSTNPTALSNVQREIQAIVPFYGVSSLNQEASQLQQASAVLTGFYLALSSVGLTVGLLFLALVLLRRVEADRRSIGIRRALGVPGFQIARGIVAEGLFIATLGGLAGVAGGYVIVESLATFATSTVQEAARLAVFVPVTLATIVAGVLLLSLLASAVATRAALRIEIAEALR